MPTRPPLFRPAHMPSPEQGRRDYDARRGSARARGYTHAWDLASVRFRQAHPLCAMCEREGVATAATVVDHIVPHRGDAGKFWDEANWQALCQPHHDREKQCQERAATLAAAR